MRLAKCFELIQAKANGGLNVPQSNYDLHHLPPQGQGIPPIVLSVIKIFSVNINILFHFFLHHTLAP